MTFVRSSIQDFSLANELYAGATATIKQVDPTTGAKLSTLATLYDSEGGTGTLANPQTLDSEGKWQQSVYIEEPYYVAISGLSIPDHETGNIYPPLDQSDVDQAQLQADTVSSLFGAIQAIYRKIVAVLPVSVANGGTGATTVVTARTNLGASTIGASVFTAADAAAIRALIEAGRYTTGDIKPTWKVTADPGWIMHDDGSIGDAGSGATTRANADTEALFTLFWDNYADADCPVSGGRGVSAAADFAALKNITMPQALGRTFGLAGAGSGLTARTRGSTVGEETHVTTLAESPAHDHAGSVYQGHGASVGTYFGAGDASGGTASKALSNGGDGAHNNIQPTVWGNMMIKL